MEILPMHFKTLSYCGLWSESTNYSLIKSVYRVLIISLIFHFSISEAVEFSKTCKSEEDSTQGLFLSFTFIALCLKILNFTFQREKMLSLIKIFQAEDFQSKSLEEKIIWENYTRKTKKIFLIMMILCQSSGVAFLTLPFMEKGFENITLPFKTYQPYDVSGNALYLSTYALQLLAAFYGVLINVSLDTLVYGFILLSCAQYEIFCLRLLKIGINSNNFSLKNYVTHHVQIVNLIWRIQYFFMRVITPLFFFSLITLGASIFKIIQLNLLSIECFTMCLYLMCMLYQVFFYCWHGNELTLKSKTVADAAYNSNWTKLNSKDRRNLQFIMQISSKGIVMSHHGQCTLSLNTFVWIIKTSYSALSVLQ